MLSFAVAWGLYQTWPLKTSNWLFPHKENCTEILLERITQADSSSSIKITKEALCGIILPALKQWPYTSNEALCVCL